MAFEARMIAQYVLNIVGLCREEAMIDLAS